MKASYVYKSKSVCVFSMAAVLILSRAAPNWHVASSLYPANGHDRVFAEGLCDATNHGLSAVEKRVGANCGLV